MAKIKAVKPATTVAPAHGETPTSGPVGKTSASPKSGCGSGKGGFKPGNTCGRTANTAPVTKSARVPGAARSLDSKRKIHDPSPDATPVNLAKLVGSGGTVIAKPEHVYAAAVERDVAKKLRGRWLDDNEPVDVVIRPAGTKTVHGIEIKSVFNAGKDKRSITMHDDALLRKADWVAESPDHVIHTVAIDHRDRYGAGAYKANHSGHVIYYRRGSGPFAFSKMHKVSSFAELQKLIRMPDHLLPEAARGHLQLTPAERDTLAERAAVAYAGRRVKDKKLRAGKRASQAGGGNTGAPHGD